MIYAVVFLFGGVLMLAWWLFKMEVASGHFISRREWAEERCKDWEQASRNRKQGLDELARALGYEWKRTEAKEGWEWKNPFYGSPFFKCDPFAGIDLSGHYVAPKPPTNRPTKKPTTRTAAKRGPQRRATH